MAWRRKLASASPSRPSRGLGPMDVAIKGRDVSRTAVDATLIKSWRQCSQKNGIDSLKGWIGIINILSPPCHTQHSITNSAPSKDGLPCASVPTGPSVPVHLMESGLMPRESRREAETEARTADSSKFEVCGTVKATRADG